MALCKLSVLKVYNSVIEDVISGVRDIFADEGIDEQVLQELKMLWESKLMASKAVEKAQETAVQNVPVKKMESNSNGTGVVKQHFVKTVHQPIQQQQQLQQQQQNVVNDASHSNISNVIQVQPEDKMIPIQITLPAQPSADSAMRVLTIHVPSSAINGSQLQKLLTGQVITATMGLPAETASMVLQQHVNAALQQQRAQAAAQAAAGANISLTLDGNLDDTSDDEDGSENDADEHTDEDDDDDEKDDEDPDDGLDDQANEEEPLNSADDVTDEETADLFDTDNIVVCQYDKITRAKNKWKFCLKDGIMNLEGEDFLFQKASGDADW